MSRRGTCRALGLGACLLLTPACFDTRTIPASDGGAGNNLGGTAAGGAGSSGVAGGSSGAGSSGAPGGNGGAGSSGAAGGSSGAAGGNGGGGSGSGGAGSGSGAAGSGGGGAGGGQAGTAGGSPSITWLTLENDTAPSSDSVNAALGVQGKLYGYADSCAAWSWDPVGRCMSGYLCNAGASFENWGVAVGFDFHDTGPNGSPPNSKLLWNPNDVGVIGIAWRISGIAPGVQTWVLNMDPSWQGVCSAMTCEINGPPDGDPTAPLDGSLLFSNMQKDYWGGTGIDYVFDPARVHALQFKLPAINEPGASFDFCIDALGVVR